MESQPLLESEPPPLSRAWRLRWWCHVILLGSYPLVLGITAALQGAAATAPMLPRESGGLMLVVGETLLQFGVFLGVAWLFSRASKEQLLLSWRGGLSPVWRGFVYSIAMRLVIIVVGFLVYVILVLVKGREFFRDLEPSALKVVDAQTLAGDPLYMVLNLTVVSFIMAGLREELWRAGVLAGLWVLFPELGRTFRGQVYTVSLLALIFGLGHLPQGWLGVAQTTFLGLCLGAIMVFHRSIWEAALAHGFFNAVSFGLLALYALFKEYLERLR